MTFTRPERSSALLLRKTILSLAEVPLNTGSRIMALFIAPAERYLILARLRAEAAGLTQAAACNILTP